MRISLRTFCILLVIGASLWVLAVVGPPVYCWFVPPRDFRAVIQALESRGTPPPSAAAAVQQTIDAAGPLRRAVQIGYYVRAEAVVQVNQRHLEKELQASYIAWFQNLPRPILLILQKQQIDNGAEDYQIAQGDPKGLVRGFALPFAALIGAFVALRMSKPRRKTRVKTSSAS